MFSLIQKVFAQTGQQPGTIDFSEVDPLKGATITTILNRILDFLTTIGIPIFGIAVIYGAFQIMKAGGKPEEVRKGRTTIIYAIIGYAIILVSSGIMKVVEDLLKTKA